MRPRFLFLLAAAFTAFWPAARAAESDDAPQVGSLGRLAAIHFEGAKCFSEAELRYILRLQLDYVLAAGPDQPLPALLQITEKLLRTSYQASGFADAKVVASLNSASNQVVVHITEGPRLYCGSFRVEGLKNLATNLFTKTLQEVLQPGAATNAPPAANGKSSQAGKSPWSPGSPAGLDPASWARAEVLITNVFWQLGYFRPEFTVDFKRRPAQALDFATVPNTNCLSVKDVENMRAAAADGRLVDMVIQVANEGPLCTVAALRADGSSRNADQDIAAFVGLHPNEPFTAKWRDQMLNTLLESGRFTQVAGNLEGGDADGRVTALVHLEDLPEAPALTNKLAPTAETLLRARRWTLDWTNRTEDLVWEFRFINHTNGRTNVVELVCSPRGNVVCQVMRSERSDTSHKPQFQFIVKPGLAGIWTADAPAKFLNTNFDTALQLGAEAQVNAKANDDGNRGNVTFSFAFNTDTDNKPPLTLALNTTPASMVFLATRPDFTWSNEASLLVGSHSNVWVRVDPATARLVSLKGDWTSAKGSWKGSGEWALSFQAGRFARAEAEWAETTANLPNVCDTDHPFASGMAYLARGICSTKAFGTLFPTNVPPAAVADARAAMAELFNEKFFYGFERFMPNLKYPGDDHMRMPFLSDDLSAQAMQALHSLFAMVVGQVPEVVPADTWLEAAFKLPLLSFCGRSSYVQPLIHRLVEGDQLGPVACLVLGNEFPNPNAVRQFAITGLLQSSSEGFLRDARPLLDENAALGQMVVSLSRSLGKLNDQQLEALCSLLKPADAALVRQAALALRQGAKPTPEIIEPLLEQWWNSSLKEPIKGGLRKLSRARGE